MHAEIIAIGTELTTGAKLDTNSQWLSQELQGIGIPVHYHVTVADDLTANLNVFRAAVDRSDIVLISGGLGPTLDDLTRDVLAELAQVKLVLHEPSLEVIRGMFARRNRPMPERNVVQAMFPEGSEPIPNRRGTAPGIYQEIPRSGREPCRIAAMPGVPSEMKVMFRDDVLPRLRTLPGVGRVLRSARVQCFGLGESAAEELLGDVTARGRDPEVGITVHEATITLRIEAGGATTEEALAKIAATRSTIFERMGEYAYGEEDEELEDVVVRALVERGQSVATSEIATGGLLAHRLTNVPASAGCFRGGEVLAAPPERVSGAGQMVTPREEAERQARDCRTRAAADWGLAVGYRSQPDDAEDRPSAPLIWLALADRQGVQSVELNVAGDPAIVKSRVVKSALNLLRLQLIGKRHS
jgi:nicotinamide-nucleotide amidase